MSICQSINHLSIYLSIAADNWLWFLSPKYCYKDYSWAWKNMFFSASFHLRTLYRRCFGWFDPWLEGGGEGGGGKGADMEKTEWGFKKQKECNFLMKKNRMWRKIRALTDFIDKVELSKWGLFSNSLMLLLKIRSSFRLNGWNYDHSFQSILTCYLMGLGFFFYYYNYFLLMSERSITLNKWTSKVKRALILLVPFMRALSSRHSNLSMDSMIFSHNIARNCMPAG